MLIKILGLICIAGVLAIVAVACAPQPTISTLKRAPDSLRVGTYNVHYINMRRQTGAWSVGDWERRKTPLDLAFRSLDADLVAFQEMESFERGEGADVNLTLDWLLAQNPDFGAAAVGDPKTFPSTQPVLYLKSRLKLLEQDWFFFSNTPNVIYSRTFNGSYPAFASLAKFQDLKTGTSFHVVNVHFEYKSRSNRLKSAALVAERIQPLIAAGKNVILLGDTNARRGAATQNILSAAGVDFLPVAGSTYHFNKGLNFFGAIDHIGLSSVFQASSSPQVLRQKFEGEWPTDHYPVIADIIVKTTP